jgi:nicotinate-nucleotide--dimethylbenzimidazole phosphoribosyltransferase
VSRFEDTCAGIGDVDSEAAASTQRLLDGKTKPRRSLGRLEDLACTIASITGRSPPSLPTKAIVLMAGDHGVAQEGVSAYPSEVTWQMLLNFARGGAAINVLARQVGARLVVADLGVSGPEAAIPEVRSCRIRPGTANFTLGPAMRPDEAVVAVEHGMAIAQELVEEGVGLIGIGEMGIGNTTAATALLAAFSGEPPRAITGRGTGIDDATWARKVAAIEKALAVNRPAGKSALEILAALGGFEIAGLAGVVLGAACHRIPVVLDGFIASTAALCAAGIAPHAAKYVLASHRSVEIGHRLVLQALGVEPLFDLGMRLGEGTGAALAMPLIEAALRLVHEMATFDQAEVTDTGR